MMTIWQDMVRNMVREKGRGTFINRISISILGIKYVFQLISTLYLHFDQLNVINSHLIVPSTNWTRKQIIFCTYQGILENKEQIWISEIFGIPLGILRLPFQMHVSRWFQRLEQMWISEMFGITLGVLRMHFEMHVSR